MKKKRNIWPEKDILFRLMTDVGMCLIVLILIIMAMRSCQAQAIGMNGAGLYENADAHTWELLDHLDQPITFRVPGGAVAKFADPWTTPKGWGLTHEGVDSIQTKYGSPDEEDQVGALEKWHGRVDSQPDSSYLDAMINTQRRYPDASFIWVANVFIPADHTVSILTYLISRGVNVVAVEMGNESYSQLDYNFALYETLTSPIVTAVKAAFPALTVSHIAAPVGKGRREQYNWNRSLFGYLSPDDWVTAHYYLGSDPGNPDKGKLAEIPATASLSDRKNLNYNSPTAALQDTFDLVAAQLLAYPHSGLDSLFLLFPGHTLIITETNTQPAAPLGDTYLNSAYQFTFLVTQGPRFRHIAWHNGVSPDVYGMISRRKKDEAGPDMIARTTYHSFDLAGNVLQAGTPKRITLAPISITQAGKHVFWYENTQSAAFSPLVSYSGCKLDSVHVESVTAPFLSSNQITRQVSTSLVIPAASYGTVTFYTSSVITGRPKWWKRAVKTNPDTQEK